MRLLRPILNVMRMRLAQIGMAFSIQAHRHRDSASGRGLQMNGKTLLSALVDALRKVCDS